MRSHRAAKRERVEMALAKIESIFESAVPMMQGTVGETFGRDMSSTIAELRAELLGDDGHDVRSRDADSQDG